MEKAKASFARHPTLHYCLLMSAGAFGVWVSMPLFFRPQSTLEWIDWTINLFIFIRLARSDQSVRVIAAHPDDGHCCTRESKLCLPWWGVWGQQRVKGQQLSAFAC